MQDVGAYIHRSGRTGRAGRTGTSVVFYKLQQEYLIKLVEKKAVRIFPLLSRSLFIINIIVSLRVSSFIVLVPLSPAIW